MSSPKRGLDCDSRCDEPGKACGESWGEESLFVTNEGKGKGTKGRHEKQGAFGGGDIGYELSRLIP